MKKEVQEYIVRILQLLKEKLGGNNHNFAFGEDGKLCLWVMVTDKYEGKMCQSIIFDENYEDITPKEVVDKIIIDLHKAGYNLTGE